jgi:hypothetical protein
MVILDIILCTYLRIFFICKSKMSVPIILLKEGTQSKQGRGQILSNINACCAVADNVRTTLGPRGLDKLLVDRKGCLLLLVHLLVN